MDRRDFPAVHLRNIPQMHHVGKVPFGYGDGRFSISLAHTGRIPHREAARGNTPIPSKRLPSLMSGMARGAVSLHGKHPFQCGRRNAQPPGNRNIVFTSSSTALPQTIRVWERRSISRRISIPALCSSGTLSFKKQRQVQERADRGKARLISKTAVVGRQLHINIRLAAPCGGQVC